MTLMPYALLQPTTKFVSVQSSSKVIYEGDPSWLVSEIFSHDRSLRLSVLGVMLYTQDLKIMLDQCKPWTAQLVVLLARTLA